MIVMVLRIGKDRPRASERGIQICVLSTHICNSINTLYCSMSGSRPQWEKVGASGPQNKPTYFGNWNILSLETNVPLGHCSKKPVLLQTIKYLYIE